MAENNTSYSERYGARKQEYLNSFSAEPVDDTGTENTFVNNSTQPSNTQNSYAQKYGARKQEYLNSIPSEPEPFDEDAYGTGIWTAFKRGFERVRSLPDVAQGDYEELAGHMKKLDSFKLSPRDISRQQELQETDGFWEATKYYFKNPALIGQIVAESLPMSVAPLVTGGVGGFVGSSVGPTGTVVGTMSGAYVGSYSTEYFNSITDHFQRQGIDTGDAKQLKKAFGDEAVMLGAREFANARGIPVGVFDALSFGLAGRIYKPIAAAAKGATKSGVVGGVAGAAAEMSLQASAGMAGETGAQISSVGEIEDIPGIVAEGFGELVPGAIEQAVNSLMSTHKDTVNEDPLSKQLNAEISDAELDAMSADINNPTDVLGKQAADLEKIQNEMRVRKYKSDEQEQKVSIQEELDAQAAILKEQEEGMAFLQHEQTRDATLEALRKKAEYEKTIQDAEADAQLAEFEDPRTSPLADKTQTLTDPVPGTAIGDALIKAQEKENTRIQEEGVLLPAETPTAPTKPNTIKGTRKADTGRDSLLVGLAKMPINKKLNMDAFSKDGADIKDMRDARHGYGGKTAFSKHKNALRPSDLVEYLKHNGYTPPDGHTEWTDNLAVTAVIEELQGQRKTHTPSSAINEAELQNFDLAQEAFDEQSSMLAEGKAPKVYEVKVDGVTARVSETFEGDISVSVPGNETVHLGRTRKNKETNAAIARQVIKENNITAEVKKDEDAQLPPKNDTRTLSGVEQKANAERIAEASRKTQEAIDAKTTQGKQSEVEDQTANAEITEKEIPFTKEPKKADDSIADFDKALERAANESATSPLNDLPQPSDAQKKAGNYKKGHVKISGLDVTIENPKGSERRGTKMKDHYGYVKRTEGADKDQVDVFISPRMKQTDTVWVIDQTTADGTTFDEHKVMIGYGNKLDAIKGYKRNYDAGHKVGPITEMTTAEFKQWLKTDTTTPASKKQKTKKPSRQERKFVRTKKGLKYSVPKAKQALLEDTQEHVPGATKEWVQQVIGEPTERRSPNKQKLADKTTPKKKEKAPYKKVDVEETIKDLLIEMPGLQVEVYESTDALPDSEIELKTDIQNSFSGTGTSPRGAHNALTGKIYLFADQIDNADQARQVLLHEGVAHEGLRVLYKDEKALDALLEDVYKNATDKKMLATLHRAYKNISNAKTVIAEEYIAHMAERNIQPALLKKIYASIRGQLRRLGIVKKWTDADIHALLLSSRKALRKQKSLDQITLKDSVKIEETGEVFDIETNAAISLRQADKRIQIIKTLKACL